MEAIKYGLNRLAWILRIFPSTKARLLLGSSYRESRHCSILIDDSSEMLLETDQRKDAVILKICCLMKLFNELSLQFISIIILQDISHSMQVEIFCCLSNKNWANFQKKQLFPKNFLHTQYYESSQDLAFLFGNSKYCQPRLPGSCCLRHS